MGNDQKPDQFIGTRGWGKDVVWLWVMFLVLVMVRVFFFVAGNKVRVGDSVEVIIPVRVVMDKGFWYRNLYFVIDKSGFDEKQKKDWVGYKIKMIGKVDSQIKRGIVRDLYKVYVVQTQKEDRLLLGEVWQWLSWIRGVLLDRIDDFMPWPESALLKGLLFGTKEDLGEYERYLKQTGTIHTVAASGFNVMIVFGVVFYGLGLVIRQEWALVMSLLLIWAYGVLAGLSAPVVRAVVMGSLMILVYGLKAVYKGFYALGMGVGLILLIWPEFLFSVSFQLSVLATIGIMGWGKWLGTRMGFLGEEFGITIAAQIMTWPVLMFYFGQFNLISFIANGLILWTVPVLTIGGFVVLGISFISVRLAWLLGIGLWFLEVYFLEIIKWLAGVDWFLLTQKLNLGLIWAYYLLIVGLYWKKYKRWILS